MSIIWLIFVIIGLVAAFMDLSEYRIPNMAVLALCLLFMGVAVLHKGDVPWFDHLSAGLLALIVGILFYTFRQMGAGDAKLLAGFALWSGISALIPLLFWIAVSGLALMLGLLGLRRLLPSVHVFGMHEGNLPRVLTKGEGIPFGAGIVVGAIVASHYFPNWLWQP